MHTNRQKSMMELELLIGRGGKECPGWKKIEKLICGKGEHLSDTQK